MVWHLENPDAGEIRRALEQANQVIPAALIPPDMTHPGYTDWLEAFWELGTERQLGFGAIGPIPWSAIRAYSQDWDDQARTMFLHVIRKLDKTYLDFRAGRPVEGQTFNRDQFRRATGRD